MVSVGYLFFDKLSINIDGTFSYVTLYLTEIENKSQKYCLKNFRNLGNFQIKIALLKLKL